MIRKAKPEDLGKIFDVCEPLYRESKHPFKADKDTWVRGWKYLLDGPGVMFVAETDGGRVQGAFGGVFFPDMNNGLLKATELLWYVAREFRGKALGWKLVRLFWQEAKNRGVKVLTGSALEDSESGKTLRRFYFRNGFVPLETVFVKEL